jgi:hypothetical protein
MYTCFQTFLPSSFREIGASWSVCVRLLRGLYFWKANEILDGEKNSTGLFSTTDNVCVRVSRHFYRAVFEKLVHRGLCVCDC